MTQSSSPALHTSALASLPLLARGKVRDNYAVGDDRILMVASDRLSAFDVIMGEPIPGKGELLTQMALFWFDKLGHICPNHLTGENPESVVSPEEAAQVRGRSMLVQRLKPIPVEAVVRGYLAGSGWKEYQESQSVCGVPLPTGLTNAAQLPEPIYTPAAKAAMGEHDENITFERTVEMIGLDLATRIRDLSIAIYKAAAEIALTKGMIIADTKFEFGLAPDGTLVLMDEVLTPDSSRYWPVEGYAAALAAVADEPDHGRDVDDPPPPFFHHGAHHCLAAEKRPFQIGIENAVPVALLHHRRQTVAGDAGVGHQDVDGAAGGDDLLDALLHRLGVGHVEADHKPPAAGRLHQAQGFLGRGGVGHVVDADRGAHGGQADANGPADAAAAAGHQGDGVFQCHFLISCSRLISCGTTSYRSPTTP